jgi:spore coat polysaccharide biosynthesis predicted glycosyltransferase SpsG
VNGPGALFRVDAGPGIGLGHLDRCRALALALRDAGIESRFLGGSEVRHLAVAAAAGFPVEALGVEPPWTADDLVRTLGVARGHACDIVVIDSDHEGFGYLDELVRAGLLVVAVDDLAPHPFPCQLVVNNDANAEELPYVSSGGETRFLLGPRYALLGPEFRRDNVRRRDGDTPTVLVSIGGADPFDLTPALVAEFDRLPGAFSITAIVGPFATNGEAVETTARRARRAVRVEHAPRDMAPLLRTATIAVSGGGQTLYRLARVGCPTIAVQIADNQRGQLATLGRAGMLEAVPVDAARGVGAIVAAASALLADAPRRARMQAAGRRLVDGRGAGRVSRAIVAAWDTRGRPSGASIAGRRRVAATWGSA